jgi:hypothetical protein
MVAATGTITSPFKTYMRAFEYEAIAAARREALIRLNRGGSPLDPDMRRFVLKQ